MTNPILVRTVMAATSGLPKDASVIDNAFMAADLDTATLDGILDSLDSFWRTNNAGSGGHWALSSYLSGTRSRTTNAARHDVYDLTGHLDGSPHGSPVYTRTFTLQGAAGGFINFPDEVAARLSLKAANWNTVPEEEVIDPGPPPVIIRPRSRYRGGFFIGPLLSNASSVGDNSGNIPRPSTELGDDLDVAVTRFQDERPDWGVWSRADETIHLMVDGAASGVASLDNAFDTIRKRGPAATSRRQVWP